MTIDTVLSLARDNVKRLQPYSTARDEFQGVANIFLDANENPFSTGFNRYPDPHQKILKKKIAGLKKVDEDQIFLGNGSDEAIDLVIRVFCEPGKDNVLIPQPTYGMYKVSAEINDAPIVSVSLTKDFDLDVDAVLKAITLGTKVVFLCSPNNPSGNLLSEDRVTKLLTSFNGIVVVDEAYIDFTQSESFVNKLNRYPNLVVLQTLSKAWGLAALRLGMAFAHPEIIELINKIKPPYNINAATQKLALEALEKENQKKVWVNEIIRERERLADELKKLPNVVRIHPSHANFLLVKILKAQFVYEKLLEKGIVVRDRSRVMRCEDCLRITVGAKEENDQLINSLKAL